MIYIGNKAAKRKPVERGTALTQQRLIELFNYDSETGALTRRVRTSQRTYVGQTAGSPDERGCCRLMVDGRLYLLHRLAWLYVTGQWPQHEIDHVDGNPSNNAFSNLRDVPHLWNVQNVRRARGRTMLIGVQPSGAKFRADICVDRKNRYLGTFDTKEEARAAYVSAKRVLHKGCAL